MLEVKIICVGKLKERYLTEGCAEYCKRLAAYGRIRITELEEVRLPERPGEAQIRAALEASALPEVRYFMERFLPAFGQTLDELTQEEKR